MDFLNQTFFHSILVGSSSAVPTALTEQTVCDAMQALAIEFFSGHQCYDVGDSIRAVPERWLAALFQVQRRRQLYSYPRLD